MDISEKLYQIGKIVISFFSLIIFSYLSWNSFIVRPYMPLNYGEYIVFFKQSPLIILLVFSIFIFLISIRPWLERIKISILFIIGAIIHSFFFIYTLFTIKLNIRADSDLVMKNTKNILNGKYSDISDVAGYLSMNPHQLGLSTFEQIVLKIFNEPIVFVVLNFIFLITSIYLVSRINDNLGITKMTNKYFILLANLFLPIYLHVFFIYGHLPSIFFFTLGLFFLTQNSKNYLQIILGSFLISIAYLLRSNTIIFIIALLIFLVLQAIKEKKIKNIMLVITIITTIILSSNLMRIHYESLIKQKLHPGTPMISYVAMGLRDLDPSDDHVGGWWDGFNSTLLVENNYNQKKAQYISKRELDKAIKKHQTDSRFSNLFFRRKIISTWLEPTFQSVWSGPIEVDDFKQTFGPLKSLYGEGELSDILNGYMSAFLILTYTLVFLAIVLLLFLDKEFLNYLFYQLTFIGGFIFHIIWETKSQYVFLYIFLVLPILSFSLDKFSKILLKIIYVYSSKRVDKFIDQKYS